MNDFDKWRDAALRGDLVPWDDVVRHGFASGGTGALWERYFESGMARLIPIRRKFIVRTFRGWLRGLLTGERRYPMHYYFVFELGRWRRVVFREELERG